MTEDECRKLQEESESFNDEMIKFIDNMFGRENMISEGSTISENDTICINIKYHKIGEVFNYKVGMSEMTLRVDKCDRCSGCAFENYIYDCVKSGCLGCEREDGENIIPKITDKRGMLWKQPHRRYIEIDEEYALMTKQTFEGLREYSVTIPSGEYEGKMWKANRGGIWYLYWYDHDDNPSMIKIERREILLLN